MSTTHTITLPTMPYALASYDNPTGATLDLEVHVGLLLAACDTLETVQFTFRGGSYDMLLISGAGGRGAGDDSVAGPVADGTDAVRAAAWREVLEPATQYTFPADGTFNGGTSAIIWSVSHQVTLPYPWSGAALANYNFGTVDVDAGITGASFQVAPFIASIVGGAALDVSTAWDSKMPSFYWAA